MSAVQGPTRVRADGCAQTCTCGFWSCSFNLEARSWIKAKVAEEIEVSNAVALYGEVEGHPGRDCWTPAAKVVLVVSAQMFPCGLQPDAKNSTCSGVAERDPKCPCFVGVTFGKIKQIELSSSSLRTSQELT